MNQLIDGAETAFTAAKSAASQADIDRVDRALDALLVDVRAWGFKVCGGQRASNG